MSLSAIEKTLSPNDTGETGSHQAGILVPKDPAILDFFPRLDPSVKNPRAPVDVLDDAGREWTFSFIYYNNKFFGGTRDEFRLTGMTSYFREFDLKPGDAICLVRRDARFLQIGYRRAVPRSNLIRLSLAWRVIDADV